MLKLIDEIDVMAGKLNDLISIDGHIYCIIGCAYNSPLLVTFGVLRILMHSEIGERIMLPIFNLLD